MISFSTLFRYENPELFTDLLECTDVDNASMGEARMMPLAISSDHKLDAFSHCA